MNAEGWRSPASYPDPKRTSLTRWAWEFLRRNEDYRRDWRRYVECCKVLRAKYGTQLTAAADREPTRFAFSQGDPLGCIYEPPRENGENKEEWGRRVERGTCTPLSQWLSAKWGFLGEPLDPEAYEFKWLWASWSGWVHYVAGAADSPFGPKPAIAFDLAWPLEPQIKAARRELRGRQKYLRQKGVLDKSGDSRAQPGTTYRRYLQVLDALECCATQSVIGKALFPKESAPDARRSKVRATIRAAEELRDGGYRRLPTLSAPNRPGKIRTRR